MYSTKINVRSLYYISGEVDKNSNLGPYIYGVFGTTGQVVPTSGQVVETTCECSVVSTTDFYQLSGSVQLQI